MSQIRTLKPRIPRFQNVTIFKDRTFKVTVKLKTRQVSLQEEEIWIHRQILGEHACGGEAM